MNPSSVKLSPMLQVTHRGQILMMTPEEGWTLREKIGRALATSAHDETKIIPSVCEAFDIHPMRFVKDTRQARVAYARHVAMWLYRLTTNYSLAEIGEKFPRENGNPRDHGTVFHACRRIQKEVAEKTESGKKAAKLLKKLAKK